jgi:hypothetical protein
MARLTPLWMQNGAFPAPLDRRLIGTLWPAGGALGMAPTVQTGTMNIQLAQGAAVVPDFRVAGAAYLCTSDGAETVALPAAPQSGQDRIDLVVVRPRDGAYAGADNDWIFEPVVGVPGSNPLVPSVPVGTLVIAQQRVVGGSASIVAANLLDRRLLLSTLSTSRTLAQISSTTSSTPTTTNVDWITAPPFTTDGLRRVKVTSYCANVGSAAAGDLVWMRLMEGTNVLGICVVRINAAGGGGQVSATGIWHGIPPAGSHTYKLNCLLSSGVGPASLGAGGINPGFLIIEDAGT